MFKRRTLVMLLVAIALGVSATWMANRWLLSRMPTAVVEPEVKGTQVVVAALEIAFGQKIESSHLKVIQWPSEIIPQETFHDPKEVEGKIANQKILPNEIILPGRVVDQLNGSVLAALVTPDKRAVTVRANDVIGVAGFLLPGNRVDVIATRKESNTSQQSIARTILQNLKVLAVDQTAAQDKDQPVVGHAVTLEMTQREAEILVKATDEGSIQLALRNPTDHNAMVPESPEPVVESKPRVIGRNIRPKPVPSAPQPPKPEKYEVVTLIRGTEVQQFKKTANKIDTSSQGNTLH